jgi:hypothetical protein
MPPPNQLEPADKLRGRSNFLTWIALIGFLLTSLGMSKYMAADAPLDAGHQKAIATVLLNIADPNIAANIQHAYHGKPLPQILAHLTSSYTPSPSELMLQLNNLPYIPGESMQL